MEREGYDRGQPVEVVEVGERFRLLSGHHRTAAVRLLGWDSIPCRIRYDVDPESPAALLFAMVANAYRRDPTSAEEAEGFGRLVEGGLSVEEIADAYGRQVGYVRRRLDLLQLDPAVRKLADSHGFSWAEALGDLPWQLQRDAVRALESDPMNRAQWARLVGKLRERHAAMVADESAFTFTTAEWSTELAAYVTEATAPSADDGPGSVLGASEAADLFGWKLKTFHQWQHRGIAPPPDMTVNGAPAWWERTLREWANAIGRAA